MRILHIGDFHYKSKGSNYEQNLMIEKMVEALKQQGQIDFIFFSGDLIHNGGHRTDFESAYSALLQKLGIELNVREENIIICAGNHDIDRELCTKGTINYFDSISDNSQLDSENTKNTSDFQASLKPTGNFYQFLQTKKHESNDRIKELYSTHIRTVGTTRIGILAVNSAWLSSGFKDDKARLMIPRIIVKDAVSFFKENNVKHKFILIHHPFTYLREFNAIEIEDIVNKEFNLKFTGHVHRESLETKYVGGNGIYTNTTQAALTFDKDGEIGYSIIDYDQDNFASEDDDCEQYILVHRGTYIHKERKFQSLEPVKIEIPCGVEKAKQNKLRRKITEKYRPEVAAANELLLDYEHGSIGFLDLFTPPTLNTQSITDASDEKSNSFDYDTIYKTDDNYIFFGKDKCGKTSLLKKIQLYYIKNYSTLGKVPLYLDYKDLENNANAHLNIQSILSNYYAINFNDAESIVAQGKLILLLDNLDTSSVINTEIVEFLECNQHVRFIVCSEHLTSRIYFEELDHLQYKKIYFGDLTRSQIRQYTDKRTPVRDNNKKEDLLDRISNVCKQLQLPANYWTVSLILLIYKKSNEDYNKNLFGILDMCVDEILQKKQLLFARNKLTFEQYKELCSKLAHYLLINHKENTYSAENIEIINFLNVEIQKNSRLVANAKDIFDYLYQVGILKEKYGRYTFRLNGVFEYFLAYYISNQSEFKNEILSADSIYLAFKNELELYSGFKRNDSDFLKEIYNKTRVVFDTLISKYIGGQQIDSVLSKKYDKTSEFNEILKRLKLKGPIKHQIQDAIKDQIEPLTSESEVHLKELISTTDLTPEILEKYLHILARVFKNSDNINDNDLVYDIFDYLIDAYITFGFILIDHASIQVKNESERNYSSEEDDFVVGEQLLRIITNFIPVLTEVLMYDGLGHINLKKIIENRIAKYEVDAKNHQYKLFILYFLIMDIDIKGNKQLIEQIFANITLAPLKVSTLTKLNFYMAFKVYSDKSLEQFVSNKIRLAQKRVDSSTSDDGLNRTLSKKGKKNIVKKAIER